MERIGKYIIHRAAVTTGYAHVFFCQDPDLMIPVAVKLYDPRRLELGPLSPAQLMIRFVAEARALAAFDHPYIVPIKTLEQLPDGRPYFVMPYLAAHLPYEIGKDDPGTFDEHDRPKRVPLPRALVILKQLASALATLHRRGLVHRWVKPSNILLTAREGGAVKLADFSMVKLPDRNVALPDIWVGCFDYCAPEQRENATSVGPEADVFSLGILAYRLLTGQLPDLSYLPARLPEAESPQMAELIAQATDPDPSRRPPNAGALLRLLEAVVPASGAKPAVQVVRRAPTRAEAVAEG